MPITEDEIRTFWLRIGRGRDREILEYLLQQVKQSEREKGRHQHNYNGECCVSCNASTKRAFEKGKLQGAKDERANRKRKVKP